jgi:hypothetical protein
MVLPPAEEPLAEPPEEEQPAKAAAAAVMPAAFRKSRREMNAFIRIASSIIS